MPAKKLKFKPIRKPRPPTKKNTALAVKQYQNQYYSDIFRTKDKDFNANLELWRLNNSNSTMDPLIKPRIDYLKTIVKK